MADAIKYWAGNAEEFLAVAAQPDLKLQAMRSLVERWGQIDLVMYCAGHYKAQSATA